MRTEEIKSGKHSGRIIESFLKGFLISKSIPRAFCESMIFDISMEKTGIKRIAEVSVNAYLYGTPRFLTIVLERSLRFVTLIKIESGKVAPVSLKTSRRPFFIATSVKPKFFPRGTTMFPVRITRICRMNRKIDIFTRPFTRPIVLLKSPQPGFPLPMAPSRMLNKMMPARYEI